MLQATKDLFVRAAELMTAWQILAQKLPINQF